MPDRTVAKGMMMTGSCPRGILWHHKLPDREIQQERTTNVRPTLHKQQENSQEHTRALYANDVPHGHLTLYLQSYPSSFGRGGFWYV